MLISFHQYFFKKLNNKPSIKDRIKSTVAEPKPRQTPYVINDIKSEIAIYNLLLKILNKQTPRIVASKKIQTDILSVKSTSETELPLQEQEET